MAIRRGEIVNRVSFVQRIFEDIAIHILKKADYLLPAIRRRMSCEKWIHIEAFHVLEGLLDSGVLDLYVPEQQYPGRNERCDLYMRVAGEDVWVEFEAIVTNYGDAGINITDRVEHVVQDAERLREFCESDLSWLFCIVYPLAADGSNESSWETHLQRILQRGEVVEYRQWDFPVSQDWIGRAYLFKVEEE